jgi:hypothetical protein
MSTPTQQDQGLTGPESPTGRAAPSEQAWRELVAERDALRQQVADLQRRMADLQAERDDDRRAVEHLTREDHPFDPRLWANVRKEGGPGEQVLAEIEQLVRDAGQGSGQ